MREGMISETISITTRTANAALCALLGDAWRKLDSDGKQAVVELCAKFNESNVEPEDIGIDGEYILIWSDNKVGTIKAYREFSGLGLKEAKDFVEGSCDLGRLTAADVRRFNEILDRSGAARFAHLVKKKRRVESRPEVGSW